MGFERNPLKLYRELDNPVLLLDTIFYRKSLEVTGINHFVSSSDGEAIAEPLYRELDNLKLLLDTIFYRKSLEVTGRELRNPILLLNTIFYRKPLEVTST
jgi:hypothetical protein